MGLGDSLNRSSGAVVRAEQIAEALPALDVQHRFGLGRAIDQPVVQPLMAVQVVMRGELFDGRDKDAARRWGRSSRGTPP